MIEKGFKVVEAMGLNATLLTFIVNFEGFGLADMDPRLASHVVKILSDHYPERLRRILLVDSPYIFQPVWKAVRRVLSIFSRHWLTHFGGLR